MAADVASSRAPMHGMNAARLKALAIAAKAFNCRPKSSEGGHFVCPLCALESQE